MFPYRDENVTQRPPYVTISLITANVLAWLFLQGAGASLSLVETVCNLGLISGELTGALPPGTRFPMGEGLEAASPTRAGRSLTSSPPCSCTGPGYIYSGICGLPWLFGNNVEDAMGRPQFVVFYLLCGGLAAALLQVLTSPASGVPMVGASGQLVG